MKAFFFFCSCEVLIKICYLFIINTYSVYISTFECLLFIAVDILILSTVSITAGDEARFLLHHQFW